MKIEYEEISGKCHPKTFNLLCHDNFEIIEIVFQEAALPVTVSEASKMEILVYEMQTKAWIMIIPGDKIFIFRFYSFAVKIARGIIAGFNY